MTPTTQTPKAASSAASKKPVKLHNAELIGEATALLNRLGMTAKDLAGAADVSESILSPWFKQKYTGDVAGIEAKIASALVRLRATGRLQKTLVETPMTQLLEGMAGRLMRCRLTGLLFGPHGDGKSSAAVAFSIKDPTTLLLTVTRWNNTVHGVERALMTFFSKDQWMRSGKCRGDFITAEMVGSGRLIIVDGADNLTTAAKSWLLDLAEQTGGALLFICGPKAKGDKEHPFLADARVRASVSMSVEARFKHTENAQAAAAVLSKFPEFSQWLPALESVAHEHCLGRAIAVAALAADMVKTGTPPATALECAAVNCGCQAGVVLALEG